jgi:hypothetical protein
MTPDDGEIRMPGLAVFFGTRLAEAPGPAGAEQRACDGGDLESEETKHFEDSFEVEDEPEDRRPPRATKSLALRVKAPPAVPNPASARRTGAPAPSAK